LVNSQTLQSQDFSILGHMMTFLHNEFTPINNGAYIHYIKELEPARNGWNFIPEWVEPMSGLSGENTPDYSGQEIFPAFELWKFYYFPHKKAPLSGSRFYSRRTQRFFREGREGENGSVKAGRPGRI